MKNKSTPIKKSELTLSVERALKRAKKRAYEIARAQYADLHLARWQSYCD